MLFKIDLDSKLFGIPMPVNIILPEMEDVPEHRTEFQTLWLLHGAFGNNSHWSRYTSIERYAQKKNLAVIMPDGRVSFYDSLAHGWPYWEYLTEELPGKLRMYFPLSSEKKDNFIAGFSMGGYGTLNMALRCPDKFAAAVPLAPAIRFTPSIVSGQASQFNDYRQKWIRDQTLRAFGEDCDFEVVDRQFFEMADKAEQGTLPHFIFACGKQDALYATAEEFYEYLLNKGHSAEFIPVEGAHNWDFADEAIRLVIDRLPTGDSERVWQQG